MKNKINEINDEINAEINAEINDEINDESQISMLHEIPCEIIYMIIYYLTDEDLKNFMLISKRMYYLLLPEFEKTKTFGRYLHNYFLAFYLSNNENSDALHNSDYGKRFNLYKYCNFYKLQESMFVISRIGNIWSWRTLPFGDGKYKRIICQCETEYCTGNDFVVDINLRTSLLNIAIKLDMWQIFIKDRPGFKKAFNIIRNDLKNKENELLYEKLTINP